MAARIKRTQHVVPGRRANGNYPNDERYAVSTVIDEKMPSWMFDLLFGQHSASRGPNDSLEVTFSKPGDLIGALPGLPIVVGDVQSNSPNVPLFPLRAWAGYVDGHVRYCPDSSEFSFHVRSRVLKMSGYWDKTPDSKMVKEYLEA